MARIFWIALFLVWGASAQAQDARGDEFRAWARGALHPLTTTDMSAPEADLAPMGSMIGDAKIVALAEATHGAAEPLAFRNRLFKYLVQEHGFKAIAIESGIVEGEVLNDYVLGGPGDLTEILAKGLSWTFDTLPQNAELIRWLRAYNATQPSNDKIQIFGFDVPGSPGNSQVIQGPEVALKKVLRYLDNVDPNSATAFRRRVGSHLTSLKDSDYSKIKQADRDRLTVTITDLIDFIEQNQSEYTSRSSAHEYEWALRSAIGARQVDSMLRSIPVGWDWSKGASPPWRLAERLRDRAMADNLDWILQELGPNHRLLVYAAQGHLATAPITYFEPSFKETADTSFGIYVKHRYGNQLLTIGTLASGGTIGACGKIPRIHLSGAPPSSVNALMNQLHVPLFALDLRAAPPEIASWLSDVRDVWLVGSNAQKMRLSETMDLVVFMETFSTACSNGPGGR